MKKQKEIKILNIHSPQMPLQRELNYLQSIHRLTSHPNARPFIPIDIMGTVFMLCPDTGTKLTVNKYKGLLNVKTRGNKRS